ncbi:hypothetical protein KAI92_03445 [Candidatus Parcubacteria bacterium]|nr:hypothetical protein [Candidatus Parcubacteria bacterium]
MFSVYYKNKLKNIFNLIINTEPNEEVLLSNFHKLPEEIKVSWFRDGKFIIGDILADGHKYKTQAKSANDFVEMVNDTIYSVYEVPSNCINTLSKVKRFNPKPDEFKKLNNYSIEKSDMSLIKNRELKLV